VQGFSKPVAFGLVHVHRGDSGGVGQPPEAAAALQVPADPDRQAHEVGVDGDAVRLRVEPGPDLADLGAASTRSRTVPPPAGRGGGADERCR